MTLAQPLAPTRMWHDVIVIVTDDDGIQAINHEVFGRDRATDVISLTYAPMPPDLKAWTAEIAVNVQRAEAESARLGARWSLAQEVALYIAHGCDHLQDENDADDAGRKRMRRRELKWVRMLAQQGLVAELTREDTTPKVTRSAARQDGAT